MFLEAPQIGLPYSCHAITRSRLVHGFADQGVRLFVGDTLASPSTLFQIDDHPDHAQPESGSRFGNLAHCAFSSAVSGNVRILEEIHQFGIISSMQRSMRYEHEWSGPLRGRINSSGCCCVLSASSSGTTG